jgi:hypothetical protein
MNCSSLCVVQRITENSMTKQCTGALVTAGSEFTVNFSCPVIASR